MFDTKTPHQFPRSIAKGAITTIQLNLGDLCNQNCLHCHVNASPAGKKSMDSVTADRIAAHIAASPVTCVEITGGTPEMNPHLTLLLKKLSKAGKNLSVRTSLTILAIQEYAPFIELYRACGVNVIASLPCYLEENTDQQRGSGVYARSIQALKNLNAAGFGIDGPELSLVYNPGGAGLPPEQGMLEEAYRENLLRMHGLRFTRLLTIANAPIGRFREQLERKGTLDSYCTLLQEHFNPATLNSLMCRGIISVDYAGYVYDCDFNQALGIRSAGWEERRFWDIELTSFIPQIPFLDHCFCCTAGQGSSCGGALA